MAIVTQSTAFQWPLPQDLCMNVGLYPASAHLVLRFFLGLLLPFLHLKHLENTAIHHFLRESSSDYQIEYDLLMEVLGTHSYNTLVELRREEYHVKKLKKWWGTFSHGDKALIRQLIGDATTLLHTTLDWHLLKVIASCWDPALRCITVRDMDLVPILEEHDCFLSLSTLMSAIFVPPVWTRYLKQLANLMDFKRPVVEALTCHGNRVEGSMSFEFLYDRFQLLECPAGYCDDFVDLEE